MLRNPNANVSDDLEDASKKNLLLLFKTHFAFIEWEEIRKTGNGFELVSKLVTQPESFKAISIIIKSTLPRLFSCGNFHSRNYFLRYENLTVNKTFYRCVVLFSRLNICDELSAVISKRQSIIAFLNAVHNPKYVAHFYGKDWPLAENYGWFMDCYHRVAYKSPSIVLKDKYASSNNSEFTECDAITRQFSKLALRYLGDLKQYFVSVNYLIHTLHERESSSITQEDSDYYYFKHPDFIDLLYLRSQRYFADREKAMRVLSGVGATFFTREKSGNLPPELGAHIASFLQPRELYNLMLIDHETFTSVQHESNLLNFKISGLSK